LDSATLEQRARLDSIRVRRRLRRAEWFRWAVIIAIPVVVIGSLFVLVGLTPRFYRERIEVGTPEERTALSNQFVSSGVEWFRHMDNERREGEWNQKFEERQINAWLAENIEKDLGVDVLPRGVADVRLAFLERQLRVGFKWKFGPIETVVNAGVRLWVPKPNVLAIEFSSAKIGALPLPKTYLKSVVDKAFDDMELVVTWRQINDKLVCVVNLPCGKQEIVVKKVEVVREQLIIRYATIRKFSNDFAPSAN
jgi:hypothetical protein